MPEAAFPQAAPPSRAFFVPVFDDAIGALKRAWPLLFVATLVGFASQLPYQVINRVIQMWLMQSARGSPTSVIPLGAIAAVAVAVALAITFLLVHPVSLGAIAAGIDAVRGRSSRFAIMFLPFRSFRRYWLVVRLGVASSIAQSVLLALASVPLLACIVLIVIAGETSHLHGSFDGASGTTQVEDWILRGPPEWSVNRPTAWWIGVLALGGVGLAGLIAVLPLCTRLFMIPIIAVDPDREVLSFWESWRLGWGATRGRAWILFGTLFVGGMLASLSVLLCCIGLPLLGYPFLLAMVAAAYDRCLPGPREQPPPPVVIGKRPPMDSEPL